MALLLVLVFAADVFAQQPAPIKPTPGIRPHYGSGIGDTTLIVRQGRYAHLTITWWTYDKKDEMPLENYTVEIEHITTGEGGKEDEIPLPKGMEITYRVTRDSEKAPPYERKAPYNTYIRMQINTTTDTPTGVYVLHLRSKGYGESGDTVTLVVIDKKKVYAPQNL
jgi:hypothetical protein